MGRARAAGCPTAGLGAPDESEHTAPVPTPHVLREGHRLKILSRYVLKEHVGPLLFALSALTSLLLLNYIAKKFGDLVGKGLGAEVIAEFFVLSVPFTVAMTLPMAVLVSVLYAFSRLASENEVTALKASGVSMPRMLAPVLVAAAGVAALMVGFNDQVLPRANHRLRVLQGDIARKKPTFALREQVINEISPGKLSLRTGHLDEGTNQMREVTIYDLGDPTRRRTIHADSGTLAMASDRRSLQLVLHDGYIQELPRTEPGQLQRIYFHTNTVKVKDVFNQLDRSTEDNFKSDREMSICEMQKEVSQAQRDAAAAREELRVLLIASAQRAVTGFEQERAKPATPKDDFSLARLYCTATQRFGVQTAEAAEAAAEAPAQTPRQSPAARQAAMLDSLDAMRARGDSLTAAGRARARPMPRIAPSTGMGVTPPRPFIGAPATLGFTLASIEGAQARLDDDRRTANTYAVEIEKKFALSVACIVFVLLGAPVALRFPRGGVGLVLGVSLGVFALYYIGLIGGEELADRGVLSPFWAMWATNVLFTFVGLILLVRMGKEGATARGGDFGELVEQLRAWLARMARRVGLPADRRVAR
jgi:lipopolysaccharide export system permease protein